MATLKRRATRPGVPNPRAYPGRQEPRSLRWWWLQRPRGVRARPRPRSSWRRRWNRATTGMSRPGQRSPNTCHGNWMPLITTNPVDPTSERSQSNQARKDMAFRRTHYPKPITPICTLHPLVACSCVVSLEVTTSVLKTTMEKECCEVDKGNSYEEQFAITVEEIFVFFYYYVYIRCRLGTGEWMCEIYYTQVLVWISMSRL